jgi:Saccharopine dehydrogenase NADP binding domain
MWSNDRVRAVTCDLNDLETLKTYANGCRIIIHCAGPFRYLPLNPLRAAIEAGVDYIDIAEDREYARQVQALAPAIEDAGITALNGISVVPAMEALFTRLMLPYFDKVLSVRTFAAPDTRKHRGAAMFNTMLWGVGRPFKQLRQGRWVPVYGWGEPEWVNFPQPLGKRLTYLVLEMADLDVMPRLFREQGLETIEFKAGSERPFLNRLLGLAATLRVRTGHPRWEHYTALVRAFSWLVGRLGKDEGGVIFEVSGLRGKIPQTYRLTLIAAKDGGLIPAVLAGMAAEELLSGRLNRVGLVPVNSWIDSERLVAGLRRRGLQILWQTPETVGWQPLPRAGTKDHH